MAIALISLGSNLGDSTATLAAATAHLGNLPDLTLLAISQTHITLAIGGPAGQSDFANAAALLETNLSPHRLLDVLHDVEQQFRRRREVRWSARTLDLDLLLYDDVVVEEPELIVPHRFLAFRRFVLEPAAEVAPDTVHPVLGLTIDQLREHLRTPNVFQLEGGDDALRRDVAYQVAQRLPWLGIVVSEQAIVLHDAATPGDGPAKAVFQLGGERYTGPLRIPRLVVPANDLDRAVDEVAAAIESIR
jgi:2-amino-4-hydroxy-6-hydroxymethyldihydropteridine diphosphokinase